MDRRMRPLSSTIPKQVQTLIIEQKILKTFFRRNMTCQKLFYLFGGFFRGIRRLNLGDFIVCSSPISTLSLGFNIGQEKMACHAQPEKMSNPTHPILHKDMS